MPGWHASCDFRCMSFMPAASDHRPIEDKIDWVARVILIALLVATLYCIA